MIFSRMNAEKIYGVDCKDNVCGKRHIQSFLTYTEIDVLRYAVYDGLVM